MNSSPALTGQRARIAVEAIAPQPGPLTPLELLLPAGFSRRSAVLGSACPARLIPPSAVLEADPSDGLDLLIVCPDEEQAAAPGWFEVALEQAARRLAADGMLYVMAPPALRPQVRGLLERGGWATRLWVAHFPDWSENRFLLPLLPGPADFALAHLMPTPWWKRWSAAVLLRAPGGSALLADRLPYVGVAAFRQVGGWFRWLQSGASTAINASWRQNGASFVLLPVRKGERRPMRIVKLSGSMDGAARTRSEAAALAAFGSDARAAGAVLPELVERIDLNGRPVFCYSRVPGTPAAAVLTSHPGRLPEILDILLGWLVRWNGRTLRLAGPDPAAARAAFLRPLDELAAGLPAGYRGWLEERCQVTFTTAAHQDLSPWNVLLDGRGSLGIVDWESAAAGGLPLNDAIYALVEAVAMAHSLSRLETVQACFMTRGRLYSLAVPRLVRLSTSLGLPDGMLDFSLHACFLHHAANEQRQNLPGAPGPFLETARWLAETRFSIEQGSGR